MFGRREGVGFNKPPSPPLPPPMYLRSWLIQIDCSVFWVLTFHVAYLDTISPDTIPAKLPPEPIRDAVCWPIPNFDSSKARTDCQAKATPNSTANKLAKTQNDPFLSIRIKLDLKGSWWCCFFVVERLGGSGGLLGKYTNTAMRTTSPNAAWKYWQKKKSIVKWDFY